MKGDYKMDQIELIKVLKTMVHKAMFASEKAHDLVFADKIDIPVALAYLNKAISFMSSAESFYYSQHDELCHDDIEQVFHQFDVFSSEVLTNFETNHSHQWSDIEYNSFKELFDNSVLAFSN